MRCGFCHLQQIAEKKKVLTHRWHSFLYEKSPNQITLLEDCTFKLCRAASTVSEPGWGTEDSYSPCLGHWTAACARKDEEAVGSILSFPSAPVVLCLCPFHVLHALRAVVTLLKYTAQLIWTEGACHCPPACPPTNSSVTPKHPPEPGLPIEVSNPASRIWGRGAGPHVCCLDLQENHTGPPARPPPHSGPSDEPPPTKRPSHAGTRHISGLYPRGGFTSRQPWNPFLRTGPSHPPGGTRGAHPPVTTQRAPPAAPGSPSAPCAAWGWGLRGEPRT